jgi:anti-sigma factor RsiW
MHEQAHPDTELLDRLRAGLLDDSIEIKDKLEHHLVACPQCRSRVHAWEHLGSHAMEAWPVADEKLSVGLKLARRQAMTAGRPRRTMGYPALATAAVLLIAVSAGLWTLRHEFVDTMPMMARTSEKVPDLYEDLDFYLWMANQGNDKTQEQGGNGNS